MSGTFRGISEEFPEQSSGRHHSRNEPKDEFLAAFFEVSGQGLILTDVDLTIVRYNVMGEMLMESLFGINLHTTFNLQTIEKNQNTKLLFKLLEKGRRSITRAEFSSNPVAGKSRQHYIVHVRPIYDQEGAHLGIGIGIRNTTDSKIKEQEWVEQSASLKTRTIQHAGQLKKLNELRAAFNDSTPLEEVKKTEEMISRVLDFYAKPVANLSAISFRKLIDTILEENSEKPFQYTLKHSKRFKTDLERVELLIRSLLNYAALNTTPEVNSISFQINVWRDTVDIHFSFIPVRNFNMTVEKLELLLEDATQLCPELFIASQCIHQLEGTIEIAYSHEGRLEFDIELPNHN